MCVRKERFRRVKSSLWFRRIMSPARILMSNDKALICVGIYLSLSKKQKGYHRALRIKKIHPASAEEGSARRYIALEWLAGGCVTQLFFFFLTLPFSRYCENLSRFKRTLLQTSTKFLRKLPNLKLGYKKADLHLFVKQILPIDSWHQVDWGRCKFYLLMPALTLVSLLERYLVLETATPRGDDVNRPSA